MSTRRAKAPMRWVEVKERFPTSIYAFQWNGEATIKGVTLVRRLLKGEREQVIRSWNMWLEDVCEECGLKLGDHGYVQVTGTPYKGWRRAYVHTWLCRGTWLVLGKESTKTVQILPDAAFKLMYKVHISAKSMSRTPVRRKIK